MPGKGDIDAMSIATALDRLKRSFVASAGTIVFGMEDGTVSIFGLIFGVAATTSNSVAVLIAGASGAAAAAVSMMAGAYLDAETSRDTFKVAQARMKADFARDPASLPGLLSQRLTAAGTPPALAAALTGAVGLNPDAIRGALFALHAEPANSVGPWEQALWMLVADFLSAIVPILPFVLLPISTARLVSAAVTIMLLAALGIGRARIAGRDAGRTIVETVSIGIAAALAGVVIGMLVERSFSP
jgi:vacuolar iron transporter family protein